ncbi:primase-helicase family protein [Tardiphaga sp. 862_B3_N1_1]|uniref:primase-helicase family protein n=1 Tax=Tardiphaga sp. 862_B3_N1_1 TaxID=3240763 RepID=UPI003F8CA9D0
MTHIDDPFSHETAAAGQQSPHKDSPVGEANSSDSHLNPQVGTVAARLGPEGDNAAEPAEHANTSTDCPVAGANPTEGIECESPISNDGGDMAAVAASSFVDGALPLDATETGVPIAEHDEDVSGEADPVDGAISATDYVAAYIANLGLQVGYDDSLTQIGKPSKAYDRTMINAVLAVRNLTLADIFDLMVIDCKEKRNGLKPGELRAALRHVVGEMKHARRNAIITPLLQEPSLEALAVSDLEWRRLDLLFEPIPDFRPSIAIMHFMWQVKTKVLGRDVDHHLMPVITSSIQGSGKTTFLRSMLAPLQELVTGASLLSDFSDRRTLGLFRYLVAVLDDMEMISEKQVPVLKGIITGEAIHRRMMGSSMDAKVRQMSTPIGTSNSRIEDLVPDDTGHRRFVTLLFRNGAVAKGGDPQVWQIVKSLDYELMWRSINPFEPSPLSGHLVALTQYQNAAVAPSALSHFLLTLDLTHQDVRSIAYRNIGVQAQGLHDLYEARTGKQLTKQAFSKEMYICMKNPKVPFGDKHRYGDMRVYRYRVPMHGMPQDTGPVGSPLEPAASAELPPAASASLPSPSAPPASPTGSPSSTGSASPAHSTPPADTASSTSPTGSPPSTGSASSAHSASSADPASSTSPTGSTSSTPWAAT